ncbi:hypothetical protein KMZ93_05165 [Bradyrhizobium sediminis]|uniref:Uncharacterized protein n=1 Tax=Bradyrhizobium sediminis TaxID=2840469 RepID=A0A975RXK3_9BRAD|nr:hypothetical protein [Bradyrhizobium sediminis]QWG24312.1 hypothetical protein KMZ93_05165 [Bradyrhizobium sediminis]
MANGSNEGFANLGRILVWIGDHIGAAWQLAYTGNSIAIWMTGGIVVAGISSYLYVKSRVISPEWLAMFEGKQREYFELLRDYICSTKIFSVGVFFISSVLFVIVNTASISAAGYPFSEGSLAVIAFIGKAGVVLCILFRVTRLALALIRFPA